MRGRLKHTVLGVVAVLAFAQLVRPGTTNPPIDPARTIQGHVGTANGLGTVLDRACRDCHSNNTVWPWYTRVAPVSWAMAYGVTAGRKAVNFSEWSGYQPEQQRTLLAAACEDVSTGRMPGAWTRLHPEAKLSPQDIATVCAAAPRLP
jgi:heme-binding protein